MSSTEELKSVAIYYPNRMGLQKVKVSGTPLLATNDTGAACHEKRHFINLAAVLSLDGGREMIEGMVDCDPPVTRIAGLHMQDQRVLGMLRGPLDVEYKVRGARDRGRKIILRLENVLVVDKLPVPLHISTKNLETKSKDPVLYTFMNEGMQGEGRIEFAVESLPAEYRTHPFYADDGTHFLGLAPGGMEQHSELQSHLEERLAMISAIPPSRAVRVASCAHCGALSGEDVTLMKCGRCLKTFYCSQDHQRLDWSRHKRSDCLDLDHSS
jgi:hypothetical protein